MLMWTHRWHMGEPVTFLLCTPDGQPADAAAYLDDICRILQTQTSVDAVVERVYRPLLVYVSLLDDPDAEPTNTDDGMEALPDEWSLFHLALVMEHAEAVRALLNFHQQHAFTVLENVLNEKNRMVLAKMTADDTTTASFAEEGSSSKDAGHLPRDIIECQVRKELGGTIVLFGQEASDTENCPQVCNVACVTTALKPLLKCLLYEQRHSTGKDTHAEEEGPAFGFATRMIQAHCDALPEFCVRLPSLIVECDTLYEVCHGDLVTLCDILKIFCGLLLPVVHGKRMEVIGSSSRGGGKNATSREASYGVGVPRGFHPQQVTLPPFMLSCKPQEHQQLAFLVNWTNYRHKASLESKPPGSARKDHEANVLSDFQMTLWKLKKSGQMISSNYLWSGLLFVLSRLISRDCSLERFLDIIKQDYFVSSSDGMPVTFIAAIVAGATVAAFLPNSNYMQLLSKKVEVLLVDVPGEFSPLRAYILSQPATHAERFEELWLAETPFSTAKKFESRAEMFYWALVEMVLLSAEKMWGTADAFVGSEKAAKTQHFLQDWLSMCQKFFLSLRDRSLTCPQRRFMLRSCAEGEVTAGTTPTNIDNTTEDDESPTLQRVCEQMRLRLQRGPILFQAIYASLYPEEAGEGKTTGVSGGGCEEEAEDDGMGGKTAHNSIRDDFEAAQVLFSTTAKHVNDTTKLKFYGLYKQATIGDVNVPKPWMMDLVGRAKWEAWNELKGMSSEEAMRRYVGELRSLHASSTGISS
ncbi:acyl-CoA binding protein, putative [Trypanosoma cruzi marinkellei]|uniref:Acyl-CoA binding protein, putative n=1 Tax=Trypanosoma cruzi marinkellei TaxID=85056 RepID=K2MUY6_TRYCR|nr:acyl-CoA binding protein, putative [Trypanosoma cruzi marinkellei]